MFCPKCGTQNEEGTAFCYKCGTKIAELSANRAADSMPGQAFTGSAGFADRRPSRDEAAAAERKAAFEEQMGQTAARFGDAAKNLGGAAKDLASAAWGGATAAAADAGVDVNRLGKAVAFRIVACVVTLIMLFVPWLKYSGALSGNTFIWVTSFGNFGYGYVFPLVAIGLVTMVAGVVVEAVGKPDIGKLVFLIGCVVIIVMTLIVIVRGSDSLTLYGASIASLGPTPAPWLCLIMAALGIVSHFWKPKQP